jgi:hypothetical protein
MFGIYIFGCGWVHPTLNHVSTFYVGNHPSYCFTSAERARSVARRWLGTSYDWTIKQMPARYLHTVPRDQHLAAI